MDPDRNEPPSRSPLLDLLRPGDTLYYIETHRLRGNYLTVTQWYAVDVLDRRLSLITGDVAAAIGTPQDAQFGAGVKLYLNDHPGKVVAWQLGKILFNDPNAFRAKPLPGHPDRAPFQAKKRGTPPE